MWDLVRKSRLLDDDDQLTVAWALEKAWNTNNKDQKAAEEERTQVLDKTSPLDKIEAKRLTIKQDKFDSLFEKVGGTLVEAQKGTSKHWRNRGLDDKDIEVLEFVIVTNKSLTFLDVRNGETSKEKRLKSLKSKKSDAFRAHYLMEVSTNMERARKLPELDDLLKKAEKELEDYSSSFVPPIRNTFSPAAKQQLESTVRKINATRPMEVKYPNGPN